MASVSQALTLQDNVSPVLASILSAMKSTLVVMGQLDSAAASGIQSRSWNNIRSSIADAENALNNFNRTQQTIPQGQQQVLFGFNGWKATLVTIDSLINLIARGISGITKMTNIADTFVDSTVRLNLINDGLRTTKELQDMIYRSAQLTRSSYQSTLGLVTQIGISGNAIFKGNTESVIAFSELLNKALFLSGSKGIQREAALLQLSHALAKGVLRGEEFNSVLENAPLLMQKLSEYTGKSIGELKQMGTDGKLAANTLVKALYASADEINTQFDNAPDNFEDMLIKLRNSALIAFRPLINMLTAGINSPAYQDFIDSRIVDIMTFVAWVETLVARIQEITNTAGFQAFIADIVSIGSLMIRIFSGIVDIVLSITSAITENWSVISPILAGVLTYMALITAAQIVYNTVQTVRNALILAGAIATAVMTGATLAETSAVAAATAAQWGLNAALLACPLTWIVVAIAAVVGALIALAFYFNYVGDENDTLATRIIRIWNMVMSFFDQVVNMFWTVAAAITTAFDYAKVTVMQIMQGMANGVIEIINGLIAMLNKLPGVSIQAFDSMTFAAEEAARAEVRRQNMVDMLTARGDTSAQRRMERDAALAEMLTKQDKTQTGNPLLGENAAFNYKDLAGKLADGINVKGGKLDKVGSTKIDKDSLKYLKDIAKQEYINKYTTMRPVVNANFGDVHETADVNAVMEVLEAQVAGAYNSMLTGGVQ